MKKLLLLATLALTALAVAAPASASAYTTWTINGNVLGEGEEYAQFYTGSFEFYKGTDTWSNTKFTCDVTLEVSTVGTEPPLSLGSGSITQFAVNDPNTTCYGLGYWTGCQLDEASANVPWGITLGSTPQVTKSGGYVGYDYKVKNCGYGGYPFGSSFSSVDIIPSINEEGRMESFTLEGSLKTGIGTRTYGPFVADGAPELGLE